MNAKIVSTALIVTATVTLLVLLAFHVRVGATADSIAVLNAKSRTGRNIEQFAISSQRCCGSKDGGCPMIKHSLNP